MNERPGTSAPLQANKNVQSTSEAPASLSVDPSKKVPTNKPAVKPPFAKTSMNSFMSNLIILVLAVCAIYIWRVTVWASDAGGYWALFFGGGGSSAKSSAVSAAASATSAVAASLGASQSLLSAQAKATGKAAKGKVISGNNDVQSQIWALAETLGIKPADLSNAIRPLIDPTVPNPAEEAKRIKAEMELKAQLEATKAESAAQAEASSTGPGILDVLEEAFLD